jgi:hypothetical protein
MNENDLRDCFAMFALMGLITAYKDDHTINHEIAERAYNLADKMLEARKVEPEAEVGIVAVKRRKKREERDA